MWQLKDAPSESEDVYFCELDAGLTSVALTEFVNDAEWMTFPSSKN